MNNIKNKVLVGFQNIVSSIKPTLKESVFYKEGKLTPEEYILAGDFLTQKCPTWKWCGAAKYSNPSLPPDKQYLKTTVPCPQRANDYLNANKTKEKVLENDWVEAELMVVKKDGKVEKAEKKVMDLDDDDDKKEVKKEEKKEQKVLDLDDDDEEEEKKEEKKLEEEFEDFCVVDEEKESKNVLKARTYDVTVTYDLYYCVPRMWLMGYSEKGDLLSTDEMIEDIMEEYRNKTVTIEPHPITGVNNISVHPCRHSLLLKRLIDHQKNEGKTLEVYMSIIIFLKFLHSVVPTIQYDFTMDVNF